MRLMAELSGYPAHRERTLGSMRPRGLLSRMRRPTVHARQGAPRAGRVSWPRRDAAVLHTPRRARTRVSEGVRDAGALAGPTALCAMSLKRTGGSHRESRLDPGVPHAVFLGLLRRAPGGLTISILRCGLTCPPARLGPSEVPDQGLRRTLRRIRSPSSDTRQGAPGPHRLEPPEGPGRQIRPSQATAPRPASPDVPDTPLDRTGWERIREVSGV